MPPDSVKLHAIAWAMMVFLNLVDREGLECADMSAHLRRSRRRGIAALQSAGHASVVCHPRRADKNEIDFTKSFF